MEKNGKDEEEQGWADESTDSNEDASSDPSPKKNQYCVPAYKVFFFYVPMPNRTTLPCI